VTPSVQAYLKAPTYYPCIVDLERERMFIGYMFTGLIERYQNVEFFVNVRVLQQLGEHLFTMHSTSSCKEVRENI
jgi:hypothetical protein